MKSFEFLVVNSLLIQEYSYLEVNVLATSLKISDKTNTNFFKINFVQSEKRWDKHTFLMFSIASGTH